MGEFYPSSKNEPDDWEENLVPCFTKEGINSLSPEYPTIEVGFKASLSALNALEELRLV